MTSDTPPPSPADAAWRLYATGIEIHPDAEEYADFRDMYLAGWTAGSSAALAAAPPPPADSLPYRLGREDERKAVQSMLRDVAARFRDFAIHATTAIDNECQIRTGRAIDELADTLDAALLGGAADDTQPGGTT